MDFVTLSMKNLAFRCSFAILSFHLTQILFLRRRFPFLNFFDDKKVGKSSRLHESARDKVDRLMNTATGAVYKRRTRPLRTASLPSPSLYLFRPPSLSTLPHSRTTLEMNCKGNRNVQSHVKPLFTFRNPFKIFPSLKRVPLQWKAFTEALWKL